MGETRIVSTRGQEAFTSNPWRKQRTHQSQAQTSQSVTGADKDITFGPWVKKILTLFNRFFTNHFPACATLRYCQSNTARKSCWLCPGSALALASKRVYRIRAPSSPSMPGQFPFGLNSRHRFLAGFPQIYPASTSAQSTFMNKVRRRLSNEKSGPCSKVFSFSQRSLR